MDDEIKRIRKARRLSRAPMGTNSEVLSIGKVSMTDSAIPHKSHPIIATGTTEVKTTSASTSLGADDEGDTKMSPKTVKVEINELKIEDTDQTLNTINEEPLNQHKLNDNKLLNEKGFELMDKHMELGDDIVNRENSEPRNNEENKINQAPTQHENPFDQKQHNKEAIGVSSTTQDGLKPNRNISESATPSTVSSEINYTNEEETATAEIKNTYARKVTFQEPAASRTPTTTSSTITDKIIEFTDNWCSNGRVGSGTIDVERQDAERRELSKRASISFKISFGLVIFIVVAMWFLGMFYFFSPPVYFT